MNDILYLSQDIDHSLSVGKAHSVDTPEHCKNILSTLNTYKILTQNIRSLNHNFEDFQILLHRLDIQFDFIVLTECWLSTITTLPKLDSYQTFSTPKTRNQNDGVVIYYKDNLNPKLIESTNTIDEMNCLVTTINDLVIISVYRPPRFNNLNNFMSSIDKILNSVKSYKNIIFIGDININIQDDTNANSSNYLNLLASYGLLTSHNIPTREKNCLDHCFVKSPNLATTIVCNSTVTDHSCVMISLCKKSSNEIFKVKTNKKTNYDAVINDLKQIDWFTKLSTDDPNTMTNIFQSLIIDSIDQNTTVQNITRRKYIIRPWVTPGMCRCIKNRDRLHQKLRNDPDNNILKITYKRYRNTCNNLLKKLKNSYLQSEINASKNNIKKQWSIIKAVTNRNDTSNSNDVLLHVKQTPQKSINCINDYFANVGYNLAQEILRKRKEKLVNNSPSHSTLDSLFLFPTDVDEVKQIILNLKPTKSCGWDGIPTALLKLGLDILSPPITTICNLCLDKGVFPEGFKKSIIVPIHKSGDRDCISNYRPISLLPSLSKFLKKL